MQLFEVEIGTKVKYDNMFFTLKAIQGCSAVLFNGNDHIVSKFDKCVPMDAMTKEKPWKVYAMSGVVKGKKELRFTGTENECKNYMALAKKHKTTKFAMTQKYPLKKDYQ